MEVLAVVIATLVIFGVGLVAGTWLERARRWWGWNCSETTTTSAIRWTLGEVSFEGRGVKMNLKATEKVSGEVKPVTAGGQPAPIDGAVTWTSSDPNAASVEVDPNDSKKATVFGHTVSANTPVEIKATFDADLGEGVRTIEATGAILVTPEEAQSAEILFGTPEPQ